MESVEIQRGESPIVLGLPHTGIWLPTEVFARLTPCGQRLADTDWHVDQLYSGLLEDVTTVRATFHRYLIDANRDPAGLSLYPGKNGTGLVPLTDFEGEPLWLDPPTAEEIDQRRKEYHAAYHAALGAELDRVCRRHGVVVLYDCHSIRSRIPFLFEGVLPDFSIGSNDSATCSIAIEDAVASLCQGAGGFTTVVNGRFKGGWTTRHYGDPSKNVHAIQMELAQSTYLETESSPFAYSNAKAEGIRIHLRRILHELASIATRDLATKELA